MLALALAVLVSPVLAAAQSLEAAYDSAARAAGRPAPAGPVRCWSRAANAAADAAGMPARVCLGPLEARGSRLALTGSVVLAGGAQREPLYGERPLSVRGGLAWATVFLWEAGPGEFDEESVVQVSLRLDAAGRAVPGSERLTAFHQCPERGCAYACGLTSVAFEPEP